MQQYSSRATVCIYWFPFVVTILDHSVQIGARGGGHVGTISASVGCLLVGIYSCNGTEAARVAGGQARARSESTRPAVCVCAVIRNSVHVAAAGMFFSV